MYNAAIVNIAKDYLGFNHMPAFWEGVADYAAGCYDGSPFVGADAQAWDRGMECAMRAARAMQKIGLN